MPKLHYQELNIFSDIKKRIKLDSTLMQKTLRLEKFNSKIVNLIGQTRKSQNIFNQAKLYSIKVLIKKQKMDKKSNKKLPNKQLRKKQKTKKEILLMEKVQLKRKKRKRKIRKFFKEFRF